MYYLENPEVEFACSTGRQTQVRYNIGDSLKCLCVLRIQNSERDVIPVNLDRKVVPSAGREWCSEEDIESMVKNFEVARP